VIDIQGKKSKMSKILKASGFLLLKCCNVQAVIVFSPVDCRVLLRMLMVNFEIIQNVSCRRFYVISNLTAKLFETLLTI
jgi:hypothetical protein